MIPGSFHGTRTSGTAGVRANAWSMANDVAVVRQPVLHVDHDVVEPGQTGGLGEQRLTQRDPGTQRRAAVVEHVRQAISRITPPRRR